MRKKRGIIVAAVLLAVLGGLLALLFFSGEPEPVYQGKRLSAWLEAYSSPTNSDPVAQHQDVTGAVLHIGTNAIPTLLRMLRARDSALTLKLVALAQKQHLVNIHYVLDSERHRQAQWAFEALRAEAKDAVPALMEIYGQNISWSSRNSTLWALGAIGPDARAAVPLLLRVAAATNSPDSNEPFGRQEAIYTLGRIHAESELVVPALAQVLSDRDVLVRLRAVGTLGNYGPDAKSAVPELFRSLKDEEELVRRHAVGSIRIIDPAAAALRKAELDAALAQPDR